MTGQTGEGDLDAPSEHALENLPALAELDAFTTEALAALSISWTGLVVHGQYYKHNPDFFDCVIELISPEDSDFAISQDRFENRPLTQEHAPRGKVMSGEPFDRLYQRHAHRVMWVMNPILSRDRKRGLLKVQIEDPSPGGSGVGDHWVFMEKDEIGQWQRRPIPPQLARRCLIAPLSDAVDGGK